MGEKEAKLARGITKNGRHFMEKSWTRRQWIARNAGRVFSSMASAAVASTFMHAGTSFGQDVESVFKVKNAELRAKHATAWYQLAEKTFAAGEPGLADWFRSRVLPQRPDQHVACFPIAPWRPPKVNVVAAARPLWDEAIKLAQSHSRELERAAQDAAAEQQGGEAYRLLWQAYRMEPTRSELAKLLGADMMLREPTVQKGTRAINEIKWAARSYQEIATAHFRICTTADVEAAKQLAVALERGMAVWQQVFFPLWSSDAVVADAMKKGRSPLVSGSGVMRVVLFPDRKAYLDALSPLVPGIEQSTGYFAPPLSMTFLYLADQPDEATRFHELTHQFLQDAGRFRQAKSAGQQDGFWAVEGIATYAESLQWHSDFATLGGWESPRLQTARYRWLQQKHRRELSAMLPIGQGTVLQIEDLAQWYTDAAAYVHYLLDSEDQSRRESFFEYIANVYRKGGQANWDRGGANAERLTEFLNLYDTMIDWPAEASLVKEVCAGATKLTDAGLQALTKYGQTHWFDVAGLPFDDEMFQSWAKQQPPCLRLNLERTQVSDQSAAALSGLTTLEELDLSATRVGDETVRQLAALKRLRTLWLSGSRVTESSLNSLVAIQSLRRVDFQNTSLMQAVDALRRQRPDLEINPL